MKAILIAMALCVVACSEARAVSANEIFLRSVGSIVETKRPGVVRKLRRSRAVAPDTYFAHGRMTGNTRRPGKWCGWWMRTQFGGGPEYNVAWNWSRRGVAASPHVGAVVVWRNHVGVIVGRAANGRWIVKSGNDGGAVRSRVRSVSGAVFRAL